MHYQQTYEERRAFGEALRRKRLSLRVSQARLAWEAGISSNTISQYEVNGMGITMLTMLNIIDSLDWSLEEWEEDASKILADNSWRRAGRRGKREHDDDYS